jgi:hypothetical protein
MEVMTTQSLKNYGSFGMVFFNYQVRGESLSGGITNGHPPLPALWQKVKFSRRLPEL